MMFYPLPGVAVGRKHILRILNHPFLALELKMDTYTWRTKQNDIRNEILVKFFSCEKQGFCYAVWLVDFFSRQKKIQLSLF